MPRVSALGDPPYGRARRPRRRLLWAIGLAIAAVLLPTIALATTSLGYKVSGIQYGVSGPDTSGYFTSSFAGAASSTTQAGEYGLWAASVYRTPFDPVTGNATILAGGSFSLKSTVRTVSGTFTSGTVDGPVPSSTPPCVNEVLAVTGFLTAISGGEVLAGKFIAKLTHFRRSIFGGPCRTLGATVAGVVTLAAP